MMPVQSPTSPGALSQRIKPSRARRATFWNFARQDFLAACKSSVSSFTKFTETMQSSTRAKRDSTLKTLDSGELLGYSSMTKDLLFLAIQKMHSTQNDKRECEKI